MGEIKLALWANKILIGLNCLGKALIIAIIGFAGLAFILSFTGGKIGNYTAFSEWRVLTPMLLSGLIHAFALVFISKNLLDISSSLTRLDPFEPENGKKLKNIALILAVLECSKYIIQFLTMFILMIFGQPNEGNIEVKFTINFVAWGAVFILFILAEIFKEGARLRKLNELTI